MFVHLADERPDFAIRELVDAVAEQPFVFGQNRQRGRDAGRQSACSQRVMLAGDRSRDRRHGAGSSSHRRPGPSSRCRAGSVDSPPQRQVRALAARTPQATAQTPAQPSAAARDRCQHASFRTGINFVRVDVIVTDKNGNPVNDLKPDDFEVTEQGRPRRSKRSS